MLFLCEVLIKEFNTTVQCTTLWVGVPVRDRTFPAFDHNGVWHGNYEIWFSCPGLREMIRREATAAAA